MSTSNLHTLQTTVVTFNTGERHSLENEENTTTQLNCMRKRKMKYRPKDAQAQKYLLFSKGKWATVEIQYVNVLVGLFSDGLLDILSNYPLRIFLSYATACDPMRISKKFEKSKQFGKQRYVPKSDDELVAFGKSKLEALSQNFRVVQDAFKVYLLKKAVQKGVYVVEDGMRVLWPNTITLL